MATFEAKRNTYTQLLQQQEIRNMEQNRLWNSRKSYLVEGIGLSSTKYTSNELNSYYEVLVSVYENEKCIFKDSDFTKQTTGIERTPQIEEKGNSTLYDLSGKQVLVPQKGHIYIKGNKKVIH